jgi:dephospho-CoA kinase
MLKSGWNTFCDAIALVDCPVELRRARALSRGWSAGEFERREAAQEPIEVKRRHANFVLDNSGDVSYIRQQVERCWQSLLQGSA